MTKRVLYHMRSLISAFVVRCLESVMSLVSVTKISSLMLASVPEQASLSLTWSEILEDTFSHDEACINNLKTLRTLLRIKVTLDLHLTYTKNGGNLRLVLKMKNIACISILLTKHVKYTYLYLFKFILYSIVAFKAN